jgi:hypothetical protein
MSYKFVRKLFGRNGVSLNGHLVALHPQDPPAQEFGKN